jgi:hypothetical protein
VLSIIGPKTHHDLETIREIRNALAHTSLKIDFDTKEVIALCNGLHCLVVVPNIPNPRLINTPREKFSTATRFLMIHLISKWAKITNQIPQVIIDFD